MDQIRNLLEKLSGGKPWLQTDNERRTRMGKKNKFESYILIFFLLLFILYEIYKSFKKKRTQINELKTRREKSVQEIHQALNSNSDPNSRSKTLHKVLSKQYLEKLVDHLLEFQPLAQFEALKVIQIATTEKFNCKLFLDCGGIQKLILILKSGLDEVKKSKKKNEKLEKNLKMNIVRSLSILSCCSKEYRDETLKLIFRVKGMPFITAFIHQCEESVIIQRQSILVFKTLIDNRYYTICKRFTSQPILKSLVNLIAISKGESVTLYSLQLIIQMFKANNKYVKKILTQLKTKEKLQLLLNVENDLIQKEAKELLQFLEK
ncbi:hypothetical protein M0812_23929 [Anaeramoeba flamelloides]|uniref:Nucleotide exchange factor SIL1 n=1 Tax=Anaeramoeba flamelloides TaxID=1746091 RepID=A0AAV7YIZ9_9EUKA|nr:hypothetical protein M0812_23929 [Anaeramoeba flamelloides]